MKNIKEIYNYACEEYLKRFCEKHELDYEEDSWVGKDVGTIAMVGDYFFNLDDIRYDIDNDCDENAIFEWYYYSLRCHSLGCTHEINFSSWVKGAPKPYTEEQLERISELHDDVERAKQLLADTIKDYEKSIKQ